jgi:protein-glutamine gamma-glutamyltransferase
MSPSRKPPPFLIGAGLIFWGWQSGFLLAGTAMALALEGANWWRARWELNNEDFSRIWTFCTLLLLGAVVFAFADNSGPSDFIGFFQNPSPLTTRNAGTASARTAAAIIRWLPMVFFPFMLAQDYSVAGAIPLETVSLILRLRWKKARAEGRPVPPGRPVNVGFAFLIVCLFAAAIHVAENSSYFWGLAAVGGWALWSQRSGRFGLAAWLIAMTAGICIGYAGQRGFSFARNYLETINPQLFSHLGHGNHYDPSQSKTAIGKIGRIKTSGEIVIRLEVPAGSSPPALLREAAYRTFKYKDTWTSDTPQQDFGTIGRIEPETPNGTTYVLVPKTNLQSVQIASYLPGGRGLLPLPAGAGRLEDLPAFDLTRNELGAVLALGPGLVIYNAQYGPGPMIDSAPTNSDGVVPYMEEPAVQKIIQEIGAVPHNREDAMRKISTLFAEKFAYSIWQGPDKSGSTNTPLGRFLLETRQGHCEYFATATVLLLRKLGIHARYAVGYAVHEKSGDNQYIVRQRDAHAWCLVYNEKTRRWQDFDTTPASWAAIEGLRASKLQWLSDTWSRIKFEFSKFRWGQTHLRKYLLWALAPILAMLLYQIISRTSRQRRKGRQGERDMVWPGLDSDFYEIERKLRQRGFVRGPSEPLAAWLARVRQAPELLPITEPLNGLLQLHYRYRFDPNGLSVPEREALRDQAWQWIAKL